MVLMLTHSPQTARYHFPATLSENNTVVFSMAQQYSIRVTDNDGNRLANDRIIVEARNGNQVEMSVEQFSNMSRLDITRLLR